MATYDSVILSDRPSNYWRLGETTGTTAVDLVGGANGVISGGVTLNQPGPGAGNVAMTFNGTTGKILTPVVVIPTTWTLEAWVRTTVTSQIPIVSNRMAPYTGDQSLAITITNKVLISSTSNVGGGQTGDATGTKIVADGQWHHIVVVLGLTSWAAYVDGVFDPLNVQPTGTNIGSRVHQLGIGFDSDTAGFWSGSLDEVAIYQYALTPAQIRAHYAANPLSVPYAPGSYPALVLKDGARNYWRLGEASGTTAVDVVSGVNGTISGGVTLGQAGALGDSDKAMGFNGTTGQILTSALTLPLTCTVEAWIKATNPADFKTILSTRNGSAGVLLCTRNGGCLSYYSDQSTPLAASGSLPIGDGQWHHVAWVFTLSNLSFYVDGQFDRALALTQVAAGSLPLGIGFEPTGTGFWNGTLDDLAIYPVALTASQIAAHYTARTLPYVPGTYPARVIASGPSNYWRLGEASGATAVDQVGGANGTISGGVTLGQKGALSEPDTAMVFDGTTGKIQTPSVVLPLLCSIELWVKFGPPGLQRAFFSTRDLSVGETIVLYSDTSNALQFYSTQGCFGVRAVADGIWHHAVWTTNGTTVAIYLDGVLDNQLASLRNTTPSTGPLILGFETQSAYWLGSLDDIAIYPRILTVSEILAHYQAKLADMWDPRLYPPTSPPTTGPVAYPAVTSPYPQPPGTPEYAPRPAPTLTTLTPSSVAVVAGTPSFQVVTLTGTNFTNASRISLAGVLDQFRVDETITYRDPTSLQITLDVRGIAAGAYQVGVVNQDSQASATLPFTVS